VQCVDSQHEVLFPARIVASDGDRRRLDILQFERHVRVELIYNVTVFIPLILTWEISERLGRHCGKL